MPKTRIAVLLALILPAFACTRAQSPSERHEEAPSEAQVDEVVRRIDPRDLPSAPEPDLANAPVPRQDQGRLADLLSAMSEASEEAATAEGASDCERGYASSRRFADALRQRMGGEALAPDTPERRAEFITACGRMPEEVQHCMVMGYSSANQEECARVRRDMSDEVRESVRVLMAELGPLGEAAPGPQ